MSSSDRRAFLTLLAGLPVLAACGFEPVYGTGGAAEARRGTVRAADPKNRDEYHLVARFEQRLGRPQTPVYDLSYNLTVDTEALAINADDDALRYHLLGKVEFTLTDRRTGAVALSGTVDGFTGYSATGTTVSTLTAEQDAHQRLMVMLADRVVTRLLGSAGGLTP
ncbi:hypothetical protein HA397_29235 [Escherichia coli]|nr:hypothetical protein [Escherichia coli]